MLILNSFLWLNLSAATAARECVPLCPKQQTYQWTSLQWNALECTEIHWIGGKYCTAVNLAGAEQVSWGYCVARWAEIRCPLWSEHHHHHHCHPHHHHHHHCRHNHLHGQAQHPGQGYSQTSLRQLGVVDIFSLPPDFRDFRATSSNTSNLRKVPPSLKRASPDTPGSNTWLWILNWKPGSECE